MDPTLTDAAELDAGVLLATDKELEVATLLDVVREDELGDTLEPVSVYVIV